MKRDVFRILLKGILLVKKKSLNYQSGKQIFQQSCDHVDHLDALKTYRIHICRLTKKRTQESQLALFCSSPRSPSSTRVVVAGITLVEAALFPMSGF